MKILCAITAFFYFTTCFAQNYGVLGKTYPIAEMDFLEFIHSRLKTMQANGEWQRVEEGFKKRVKAHLIRPTPLRLPRARETRIHFFNPSLTIPYEVRDHVGRIIVQKGSVINPLDKISLSSTLLFFDGDDPKQLAWVSQELKKQAKIKLILTSGEIPKTANYFKQAVYFDLQGILVNKFQINGLPAKVFQNGKRLAIQEVSL